MTKTIKISEKVHNKLKVHVAKNKKGITEFADRAIMDRIKLDNVIERNNKAIHPKNNNHE